MKGQKTFEVDFMGVMHESEIEALGSGFNQFQKQQIDALEVGETKELADSNIIFNVKRIK